MSDDTVFGPNTQWTMGKEPLTIESCLRPPGSDPIMMVCELQVKSVDDAKSLVILLAANGYFVTSCDDGKGAYLVTVGK